MEEISTTSVSGASSLGYDVFVDLSTSSLSRQQFHDYVEALAGDTGMGPRTSILVVVPLEWELPPQAAEMKIVRAAPSRASDALYRAFSRAARLGRHLVVVLGNLLPAHEVTRRLIQEFDRDPLFGTAQPRFADITNDHVWPLPGRTEGDTALPKLTTIGISKLSASAITAELLAVCTVVRREVVMEIDKTDYGLETTVGTFRLLLCQSRRRGFRNLVVNHVTLGSDLPYARLYPSPPKADMDRLRSVYPDIARADAWNANLPQRKLEAILENVCADRAADRRRALLDCRGMRSQHNDTSCNMLGLLDGFHALDTKWQFDILSRSDAAEFHELRKRYPKFKLLTGGPQGAYTAGVLLNQPWALSSVDELHQHALLVAFNMLDTISWDILYNCGESLDALWRFVTRFSDCLLFSSEFTRARFTTRFPLEPRVAQCVTYLSMTADEQVDPLAAGEPVGDHILVFGNDYDHKDVRRTVQLLANAFPFNKIVALGIEYVGAPNVVAIRSEQLGQTALHRFVAGARVIVFPSFYEGFGIPVVEGLAYGRPVVVRESLLWHEIAQCLRLPGQLVPFDSAASLVEAVGCALAGLPLKFLPQGNKLRIDEPALRWQDCAQRIIDLLEELIPCADGRRWQEREEALQAIRLLRV
jgi:glycosyltransferase involved in cell wall biosynthesis